MSSRAKFFLYLGVGVVILGVALRYWPRSAFAAPENSRQGRASGLPIPVRTAAARTGSIDITLDALGTVTARNTAVVRARVSGLLTHIYFKEGKPVVAGEVLALIDPKPLQASLNSAQGQEVRDAAQLTIARSDLDRYQGLLKLDSIARQQVDDQAALVKQYQGVVQADRGAADNARLQLSYTRITAPISGRAGLRQVDVGNMVQTTDTNGIVVITQAAPITVLFAVPSDRAPQITRLWLAHTPLRVDALDRDGKTALATGAIESIDNVVDPTTNSVKIKAAFDNRDGALFPNQFVNARVTIKTLADQTLIPASAVQHGTPGTFVYVLMPDSTVSVRRVTLGASQRDLVAIEQGLKPGDRVVTDGTDKLRDKIKVEAVVEAPAKTDTAHAHTRRGGAKS